MASRKEELKVELTAVDNASKAVGDVATAVDKLDGETAAVTLTAEDRATAEVRTLMTRVSALTDDEKSVVLNAEATKLKREVDGALKLLAKVEDEEAEAVLEAKNNAAAKLSAVQGELDEINGRIAKATVDADQGKGLIDAEEELDAIDGRTAKATVDADVGDGLSSLLGALDELPGNVSSIGTAASRLATPGGAVALLAGLLGGAAVATADAALNVQTMANFTGEDFAYVDKFTQVFNAMGGLDANDLIEMVSEVASTIAEKPELAALLGVDPDFVANHPLQGLVEIVDAINEAELTTAERMKLIMEVFGEEGGKQISKIMGLGVDLSELIEGMPSLVTEADAARATEVKLQFAEMLANAQKLATTVGGPVLSGVGSLLELLSPGDAVTELEKLNDELANLFGARQGTMYADELVDAWRRLKADLADNGVINETGAVLDYLAEESGKSKDEILDLAAAGNEIKSTYDVSDGPWGDYVDAMHNVADATEESTDATEKENEALRTAIGLVEDHIEALEEQRDRRLEQAEAIGDTGDAYLDEREAQRRAQESLEAYHDALVVVEDDTRSQAQVMRDQQRALDNLVGSIDDAADATVERARTSRQARGADLSEIEAVETKNTALLNHAATLNGPERQAVLAHILRINGIPEMRITTIMTDNDPDDLAQVERELAQASRAREVLMNAEASESAILAAERMLAWLARPRTVTYTVNTVTSRVGATGWQHTPAGTMLVGEHGPELVDLPVGASVTNAGRTAELMRNGEVGGRGGPSHVTNNYTTVNVPRGTTAADVARAQRRQTRVQGPQPS